jgi:hypothetical protein
MPYQYTVSSDNENNAGTGVSDNDVGVAGAYTAANPVEFNIFTPLTGAPEQVTLTLSAIDVDPAGGGFLAEQDEVLLNGQRVGFLTVANTPDNGVTTTVLNIAPSLLVNGKNTITVRNVNTQEPGTWQFTVSSATLAFDTDASTQDNRINTTTAQHQHQVSLATFADGSYIATWSSGPANWYAAGPEGPGQTGDGIYLQRYDAQGRPVKADGTTPGFEEVHVNSHILGRQNFSEVATLADGKFVVTWTSMDGQDGSGQGVYAQLFAANGTKIGGETRVAATTLYDQYDAHVSKIAGGYVISFSTDDGNSVGVYGQRFNLTGAKTSWDGATVLAADVYAQTRISTATVGEQSWASQLTLGDGRVFYTFVSPDSSDHGAYGKIYNADGTVDVDQFKISQVEYSYQRRPVSTELSDGRLVVTWYSYGQDGSVTGVYARILDENGTPLGDEFAVNTTQRWYEESSKIVALEDGGFLVAWQGYDNSGHGIYGQRFDAEGDKVNGEFLVNRTFQESSQNEVELISTPQGIVAAWQSESGDGNGNGVFSRTLNVEEDVIARVGGENVINEQTRFAQMLPRVATAADGSYVAVWVSESNLNSGDGDGWGVFAQRYDAQGRPLKADGTIGLDEFQVNKTTAGHQGYVHGYEAFSVAQLDGGKFIVVYADGAHNGVYGRVFNANGSVAIDEFRVSAPTGHEQWFPDVAALHDENAGAFVVTWRTQGNMGASFDVLAQRFDATGAKVTVTGGAVAVGAYAPFRATTTDAVNVDDGSEHQGRILSLNDGGWLIAWEDSGQDGSGEGLYAKRYGADGVVVGGTNPDGSATTGAFRVVQQTAGDQGSPFGAMTALKDGGWVIAFRSDNFDLSADAIGVQIYNADGTLRGSNIRVNDAQYSYSRDPAVATLADGSFVIVWWSDAYDQNDGGGYDIYAKRFAADGTVLNTDFLVNRVVGDGSQFNPSVAATNDGFIVAWDHDTSNYAASYDGSGRGVYSQRFTVESLNASAGDDGDAHRPTLRLAASSGAEDTAIALNVEAALGTGALATETLRLTLQGVPDGATVSDGAGGHSFTASKHARGVDITGWTLASLTVTPAQDSESDFTLSFVATSFDSASGDTAINVGDLRVTVDARADTMEANARSERINSFTAGDQMLVNEIARTPVASWADGSYVVVWQSNGQDGSGAGVFGQRFEADGDPLGLEFQVNVHTAGEQQAPSVVALPNGKFVVTWSSAGQFLPAGHTNPVYSYWDVYQRVFDAAGVGGAETHVTTGSPQYTNQFYANTTALSDGGYLIVWGSNTDAPDSSYGVYAQRYDANGEKVVRGGGTAGVDQFPLQTTMTGEQSWAAVTGLTAAQGGGFVAVWNSAGQDGSNFAVVAQRFGADGLKVGGEVIVNTTTAGEQFHPRITTIKDGYVVVWQSQGSDGSDWGQYGQVSTWTGPSAARSSWPTASPTATRARDRLPRSRTAGSSWPGTRTARMSTATACSGSGTTARATGSATNSFWTASANSASNSIRPWRPRPAASWRSGKETPRATAGTATAPAGAYSASASSCRTWSRPWAARRRSTAKSPMPRASLPPPR